MKTLLLAATVTCLGVAAWGEPRGMGIGVMVGEPTGISAKKWLDATHAIDGAAAWSISGEDAFSLHVDYLFHKFGLVTNPPPDIVLHYGIGARFQVREDDGNDNGNGNAEDGDDTAGVRIPIGLTYLMKENPLELFMEFAPVVDLVPDTEGDFEAAFGIRFYFR